MLKKFHILLFVILCSALWAQKKDAHLWGVVPIDSLMKEPHAVWFKKNYEDYKPNANTINQLKKLKTNEVSIKVFFGSWCGDSKRELPRLMKILDEIKFPKERLSLIAVSSDNATYKQSKNREEKGYNVFKVGCFVFEKNGAELNRIVEYPVLSLEQDIVTILSGQAYTPQYFSYPVIINWLKNGVLADDNVSASSLASHIKMQVTTPSELNACGYVLLSNGQLKEATKIFKINTRLFPDNSNLWHSLAEAYYRSGEKENALGTIEYGLKINKDADLVKEYLELHKKVVLMK